MTAYVWAISGYEQLCIDTNHISAMHEFISPTMHTDTYSTIENWLHSEVLNTEVMQ